MIKPKLQKSGQDMDARKTGRQTYAVNGDSPPTIPTATANLSNSNLQLTLALTMDPGLGELCRGRLGIFTPGCHGVFVDIVEERQSRHGPTTASTFQSQESKVATDNRSSKEVRARE